ncbi:thiamine pyrophosphate-requiring protein [Phaeacidiphilus oryzae]|uniref:thiamine pyrophosphate-requiring protein n=1 Tax=Phaeacidiphilus oryzae TaxID=348818 RepID=UPI0006893C3A|nr:thiamine pyrophosphate-requiring protein [Phaeacidiphilus oryzae]
MADSDSARDDAAAPLAPFPSTASEAFLDALAAAGVEYVFANLGSDHPGLIEAYARAGATGDADRLPRLVVCPHESVALSAAQGHAQVSGRPQAVVVHVECGTQNLGGMLHNAARGRVPVLIYAGASPYTQHGELPGSRNEFIHWLQDVRDQRGIVRGYVKYDNEFRTGRQVAQLTHRALQIARSEPAGPVYLTGPREVMEEPVPGGGAVVPVDPAHFTPVAPAALDGATADRIAQALAGAEHPLIVTGNAGRDPAAVPELVRLAESAAIRVLESVPAYLNFPASHPLHAGYQWNQPRRHPALAEADVVLVLGSDVPWIPTVNRPGPRARILVVDPDPLKEQTPLWHLPAELYARAHLGTAIRQLADRTERLPARRTALRLDAARAAHAARTAELAGRERPDADGRITPELTAAALREELARRGGDTLVLSEAVSHYHVVSEHLRIDRPGGYLASGGSSLGWYAGAAIGAKLADPARRVVAVVGDGSYLFGVPASAQWTARRYGTPHLVVVLDNQGWQAPRLSTLALHPDGHAARSGAFPVGFGPEEADLPGVAAAAGGAWGRTVTKPDELPEAVREALDAVDGGRSAVLSVHIPEAVPDRPM